MLCHGEDSQAGIEGAKTCAFAWYKNEEDVWVCISLVIQPLRIHDHAFIFLRAVTTADNLGSFVSGILMNDIGFSFY